MITMRVIDLTGIILLSAIIPLAVVMVASIFVEVRLTQAYLKELKEKDKEVKK